MKPSYVTTYCNHPHRLTDGKPVEHECRVIPVIALEFERGGDYARAIETMQTAGLRMSRGVARWNVGDAVRLAVHMRNVVAYAGKPALTREDLLTVKSVSPRSWSVVATDGTHIWHFEPGDLAEA